MVQSLLVLDLGLDKNYEELISGYLKILSILVVFVLTHNFKQVTSIHEFFLALILGEALYHLVIKYIITIK